MRWEQTQEEAAGKQQAGFVKTCYDWLEALVFAFIAVALVFTFVVRSISVSGESMVPTLQNEERVLINCLYYNPKPGDIVVVDAKATKLGLVLVKRVIATEGQVVNIDFAKGQVYVDGTLQDELYISAPTRQQYDVVFPQTVPPGHVFLMGDNRPVSEDSRNSMVGMVDQRYLMGKVLCVHYPFSAFKWL